MDKEIKYDLDNSSREKMRQRKLGANNPNFGKPRTPATKEKIAQSQRKSWEKRKIGKNTKPKDSYLGDIQFNTKEEAVDFFEELNRKYGKTIIISQEKFEALIDFLVEKTLSKTS